MQIYTRTGDDGTTGLFFGGRVRKDDPRPEAYGTVDEAQAAIGWARATANEGRTATSAELHDLLVHTQRDLWVLMAELATLPENEHKLVAGKTRVTAEMVDALEPLIDRATARFEMPNDFVIPGGTLTAAALDVARTVVRRAERAALAVAAPESHVVPYLNRLSDLLWALARWQEGTSVKAKDI
ncbi:MAG TPA: cob(I)yrinic acid a,c-diamide adenosyltransferase [Acidimicrobiales bacterium]|nr:cob(I)yrinic acid a,c-diamide adenosyltransferase [Acidimicrobiales bacterium]